MEKLEGKKGGVGCSNHSAGSSLSAQQRCSVSPSLQVVMVLPKVYHGQYGVLCFMFVLLGGRAAAGENFLKFNEFLPSVVVQLSLGTVEESIKQLENRTCDVRKAMLIPTYQSKKLTQTNKSRLLSTIYL